MMVRPLEVPPYHLPPIRPAVISEAHAPFKYRRNESGDQNAGYEHMTCLLGCFKRQPVVRRQVPFHCPVLSLNPLVLAHYRHLDFTLPLLKNSFSSTQSCSLQQTHRSCSTAAQPCTALAQPLPPSGSVSATLSSMARTAHTTSTVWSRSVARCHGSVFQRSSKRRVAFLTGDASGMGLEVCTSPCESRRFSSTSSSNAAISARSTLQLQHQSLKLARFTPPLPCNHMHDQVSSPDFSSAGLSDASLS